MDATQEKHERAVGESFVGWYNAQNGTAFAYQGRPSEAPDLRFTDGDQELLLEIADSYYDKRDAELKWKNAREVSGAPKAWYGVNMDAALTEHINTVIADKCGKNYGPRCILIVNVSPNLTTAEELEPLLKILKVPAHAFQAIYVTGGFPQSSQSAGGYRCWKIS